MIDQEALEAHAAEMAEQDWWPLVEAELRRVCRYCGAVIERRAEGWAHAGTISPRRLRFWCRTEGDALHLVEPLDSKPTLD